MQKSKRNSICRVQVADRQNEGRGGGAGGVSGKKEINKTFLVCNIYHKQPGLFGVGKTVHTDQSFLSDCEQVFQREG